MNARVAMLSMVLTGCSFIFVRGAPDMDELPRGAAVECTNSDLWPMIDSIAVGASALGLTLVATQPKMQQTGNYDTLIGTSIVSLFAYTISAIYGFVRTNSCQDVLAREARHQRPSRFRIIPPEPPAPPSPPPEAVPASTTEEDTSTPDGGQP